MKSLSKYAFIALMLILVSGCGKKEEKKTQADAPAKTENVRVMPLDFQKVARTIEYTTTLQAYEEIYLAPASPGRIESVSVEVGDRVSKGATLVQMDRTQLLNAETQLMNLQTDYNRLDTLQRAGSVARQQYDQLKTQFEVAKANIDFLRKNVKLVAPFSGVISGKYFESGEMYSGAPNTTAGKAAIVTLVQIDRLKVIVPISEKYFPRIKPGMAVKIISDIYPDKTFTGKVSVIHPTVDAGSRTFNAEVVISNSGNFLRPGMFSRVSLDLDQVEAILLPAIAVLKMQGSNDRYLFVENNGKAKRISVTIGKRYDDMIEVFADDLKKGDNVVVSGQARLLDGTPIKVVQ